MSLSRSYAQALYEAVKETKGASLADAEHALTSVADVLRSSAPLTKALFGPVATAKEKEAVMTTLCEKTGATGIARDFLVLLARKDRVSTLAEILKALRSVRLESEGAMLGSVVSAEELSAADLADLERAFGQKYGKKVTFEVHVDPRQLAGLKVTLSGVTYDGTLRSQLQRLKNTLIAS